MKNKILSTLLLSWISVSSAKALELPAPFEAVYRVHKSFLTLGDVRVSLNYDGNRYAYEKKTISRGVLAMFRDDVIIEQSRGAFTGSELHFEKYSYKQSHGKKLRESQIEIQEGLATGHHKGAPFELNIPPGTLDRTSMEIAMMRDAAGDHDLLSYSLLVKDRLKNYRFLFTGRENIDVPAGRFECKRYIRLRETNKRATSFCLAPELNYLPIHATHHEKGASFDMELVRYRSDSGDINVR